MLHSKTSSEFGMSRFLQYPSSVFFATELCKIDALFSLPSCVHIRSRGMVWLIVSPDLSFNKEVAVDCAISVVVHSSVDVCSFIRDKPFIAPSISFFFGLHFLYSFDRLLHQHITPTTPNFNAFDVNPSIQFSFLPFINTPCSYSHPQPSFCESYHQNGFRGLC